MELDKIRMKFRNKASLGQDVRVRKWDDRKGEKEGRVVETRCNKAPHKDQEIHYS